MLHACTVWTSAATNQLVDLVLENMTKNSCHNGIYKGVEDVMKLNGYTFTPKQLRGRWKTQVSSYKGVKVCNHKFGQGTIKILQKLESRPTPNFEDMYFKTCTTNCQGGFFAP